jgi:prophage regulatory protein
MFTNINTPANHKHNKTLLPNDRILRWPEVQQRVGICRSQAHQLISKSKFPAQVKLGPRASGWIESEIIAWIEQRIAESRTNDIDTA